MSHKKLIGKIKISSEDRRKVKNESTIEFLAKKRFFIPLSIIILILFITLGLLAINLIINSLSYFMINKLNGQDLDLKKVFEFIKTFRREEYRVLYIIATVFSVFNALKLIYRLRVNILGFNKGEKGTSKWTTINELKKQYKQVDESKKEYEGNGGVPISRFKDKIFIDDSAVNNLIIGTTRSGKGETYVFPAIDIYSRSYREDIRKRPSMVINDPKGELAAASYETLKERGYDIQVLNLTDPERGMTYNPLKLVVEAYKEGDLAKAQMLCNTLTYSLYHDPNAKDPFWSESAKSLVNAIILAITKDCLELGQEEKITMYTVANFLSKYGSEFKEDDGEDCSLDKFFQAREPDDIAKMQYATSSFSKGNTRASIFAVAMSKLNIFTFDPLAKMTSSSSLNLSTIGFYKQFKDKEDQKPVAIFMVTPDYDSSNHVIASIFVRQVYYVLAQQASLSKGQKCEREVIFLLDEFGNMPPIEGMANIITVCLGRNIRFNLIVQAYAQLKKLYGEDEKTIAGNCGNQIYILTNDMSTAEQFSKLIGNKTIMVSSRSGKGALALEKSKNQSLDSRGLLNPNELMSIKPGETVVQRVIKRQDLKRKSITPKPIFNTGATKMKHRYEYLADDFDTSKSILDVDISHNSKNIILADLLYDDEVMGLFLNKLPGSKLNLKEEFDKIKQLEEIASAVNETKKESHDKQQDVKEPIRKNEKQEEKQEVLEEDKSNAKIQDNILELKENSNEEPDIKRFKNTKEENNEKFLKGLNKMTSFIIEKDFVNVMNSINRLNYAIPGNYRDNAFIKTKKIVIEHISNYHEELKENGFTEIKKIVYIRNIYELLDELGEEININNSVLKIIKSTIKKSFEETN